MKGEGVIFHLGSFKDEDDTELGFARVIRNVNEALAKSPTASKLLLEVSAGAGRIIGSRLEELARVYEGVDQKDRVGFALDTQHLWASGYDYVSDLGGFVGQLERVLSVPKIWAIHVNDSKTALASKRDVHANLGEGTIGREGLSSFINHPRLVDIPLILETPGLKTSETTAQEVESLRSLLTR
jgi:deoxyribonuclease-4